MMTLKDKILVKKAAKEAYSHITFRNPFGVWFTTFYDKDDNGTYEFQYIDRKDRMFMTGIIEKIGKKRDDKKCNNNKK